VAIALCSAVPGLRAAFLPWGCTASPCNACHATQRPGHHPVGNRPVSVLLPLAARHNQSCMRPHSAMHNMLPACQPLAEHASHLPVRCKASAEQLHTSALSAKHQAHLTLVPGLHEPHHSPAVAREHGADCACNDAAICSLELDSTLTAAVGCTGNTSLHPRSSSSLNSCTSCQGASADRHRQQHMGSASALSAKQTVPKRPLLPHLGLAYVDQYSNGCYNVSSCQGTAVITGRCCDCSCDLATWQPLLC